METVDVVVLGGGAAGLFAAMRAADAGASVLVLEKQPRPGVKILASGGGRCNLTTTRSGPALLSSFPEPQRRFLRPALQALPPDRLRRWFADQGVASAVEDLEKVFPVAGRASVVRDALVRAAETARVEIRVGHRVRSVVPQSPGFVVASDRAEVFARRVILATGGRSYPKTGTTGDGYPLARGLGLPVTPQHPGLVGLKVSDPRLTALAGITVAPARVSLPAKPGVAPIRFLRPLLFTHEGISGPGPMDVSSFLAGRYPAYLEVDFIPELPFDAADQVLIAESRRRRSLDTLSLPGIPQRLWSLVLERAGLDGASSPATWSREARREVLHLCKAWSIEVSGDRGWHHAEVTVGGVDLASVNPKTMEARACPGLHVCGEILDVDGPIGGFNFQAAFATGWVAGDAAGRAH